MDGLGDKGKQVQVVAVSVDPDRDTVERLKEYTMERDWPANWFFVTGGLDEVGGVLDAYRIAAYKQQLPEKLKGLVLGDYEVVHRAAVLLINPDGYIYDILRGTDWTSEQLAEKLKPALR